MLKGENLKKMALELQGKIASDITSFPVGNGYYSDTEIPDLPKYSRLDSNLGAAACPWLDQYIAFSRKWSPRAFPLFHEAVGLWVLSTVAARRVLAHMGKERYTNLYIALTARTSLYAKSSTAEIGLQVIDYAGLIWFLAADSSTPQKFIADLTSNLPDHYDEMPDETKAIIKLRLSLAGQRGWYYDEFGQHVAAMLRDGGFMSDFRGLMRRFDDTPEKYEYGTIGRGSDIIQQPYLALLANMTPDDLRPFAKRGASLWGDGFLARFALITPPEGESNRDRFPAGERIIPGSLSSTLVDWHNRLNVPEVNLVNVLDKKGNSTGRKAVEITPSTLTVLEIPQNTREAFYEYHDGLLDLLEKNDNHDLDGNYTRLAEKALRVAILFASLGNHDRVELNHIARAQQITEHWRAGLHELYRQVNEPPLSEERENEERAMQIIQKLDGGTAVDVSRYIAGLSTKQIAYILDGLVDTGVLAVERMTHKKTRFYNFPTEEE